MRIQDAQETYGHTEAAPTIGAASVCEAIGLASGPSAATGPYWPRDRLSLLLRWNTVCP